jgi:hypothetical protein
LVAQPSGALACQSRFNDNNDGTVTDNRTGLVWEKKDGGDENATSFGGVHETFRTWRWSVLNPDPDLTLIPLDDGTLFTEFLATLNNTQGNYATCFANHCDWRIPDLAELQSILLAPFPCPSGPCIDPIFGPDIGTDYWSSSPLAGDSNSVWVVNFYDGHLFTTPKISYGGFHVHAVRGGR